MLYGGIDSPQQIKSQWEPRWLSGLMAVWRVGLGCLPNLLHVAEHILPAVKDALPLLRVQVENEVSGIVLIALLIPAR